MFTYKEKKEQEKLVQQLRDQIQDFEERLQAKEEENKEFLIDLETCKKSIIDKERSIRQATRDVEHKQSDIRNLKT